MLQPREWSIGPESQRRSPAQVLTPIGVTIVTWAVVFAYVLFGGRAESPVELPLASAVRSTVWAPQGWGFFTHDPQDERLSAFVRDNHQRWHQEDLHLDAARNDWGFSRSLRNASTELGAIAQTAPKADWTPCQAAVEQCLASAPEHLHVVDRGLSTSMCGHIALVLQRPVPWAWADLRPVVIMPSRILRIELQC